ncbi:MAG: hypothetical protein COW00_14720 [Bdellovibrio sp. CG12_big_fil_rev_8_21_14_0_65_39_13]|nr:MAG: hypothetical protein COW78_14030 [Bdellovibrio sp. CG22_combo_CG10-13_8_21_14_all_39_27]PIQ58548.1 MAG: hypothetical protein COW00_14720 [Bdellovibrio sp. CG12_big_fil_rev_8_21_14_0_65_39_13]PIR32469.1 MAG: hypothetical protein COV37_19885 [Bdellovibrio sp. CG11_big_fil_rev_8_21_14_0_20_39_38]PJB53233.1 MAG: hypothetical protein CO099_08250 [Bdellovibrio sp. CG_4_9_14_3_um_filter_39_7]
MVISKLSKQLAIFVSLFIFAIEGVVFIYSYIGKEKELREIHRVLEEDIVTKTGKHFDELHPGILDNNDIKKRLQLFSRNIFFLVLLISIVTSIGVLYVFRLLAGKRINQIIQSNRHIDEKLDTKDLIVIDNSPLNEISELIISRNLMIQKIIAYQNNIEDEVKKLEEQIIQSAKMSAIGEMTASILHDIKNPLTSLDLHLQQMQYQKIVASEKSEKMEKSMLKMKSLIDRMGQYSRQSKFVKQKISLANVIRDSVGFVSSKIDKTGYIIKISGITDMTIMGDPIALQQVFTNLLSNALDAVENTPMKMIEIRASRDEKGYTIDIEDSGIGMNDETLASIFQAFYTTKPIGKGTGLGLSSVKQILSKHEATIAVQSQLDHGTHFSIHFKADIT